MTKIDDHYNDSCWRKGGKQSIGIDSERWNSLKYLFTVRNNWRMDSSLYCWYTVHAQPLCSLAFWVLLLTNVHFFVSFFCYCFGPSPSKCKRTASASIYLMPNTVYLQLPTSSQRTLCTHYILLPSEKICHKQNTTKALTKRQKGNL